ncbi:hypothetical protein Tco_0313737 [Tanacetum coccineum]
MPEPIYPEYIPLEDEHEFLAEEQPLPHVDSPTAESPGYNTESDPGDDPEEYEDDEPEDELRFDYPMDGGDDGDDDDGDSSRDDANDEDEDEDEEDEEEEEEHLAPADSAVVVPTDEPVSPPKGTELVIPPPSTDITIGARITVMPQTSISLPPEAEVERLLAMTTPSPSPPISLSPPSVGERLVRHSGLINQALIDAVTVALPSPPLPPLPPSLYIPPPVNRRDDILESEQPPHKRVASTAEAVPEIAPMTVGEVNTRVTKLHEHDTQDLYALLEDAQDRDSMEGRGGGLCFPIRTWALSIGFESGDPSGASTHCDLVYDTRDPLQAHQTLFSCRVLSFRTQHQAQVLCRTLRVMRDNEVSRWGDMQTEVASTRVGQWRARQPNTYARILDHHGCFRGCRQFTLVFMLSYSTSVIDSGMLTY